jgi:hypothetical protein
MPSQKTADPPVSIASADLSTWLKKQAVQLKYLDANGRRLKLDFVQNASDKGMILIDVRKRFAGSSAGFDKWVVENTGIGRSTALLYIDVAKNFDNVRERFANSNGLELTLRQVRDAIRDARQERGEGKPGSGRQSTNRAIPPTSQYDDGFPCFDDESGEPEPDLGPLGTFEIGPGGVVATAHADAFQSVSAVDRKRKLLVCRGWDGRTRDALARGIAVLVLPELQEGCRP